MDAVILAGEKEGAILVKGENKALLPFRELPLICRVVSALDRAETVSSITVVGPREKLEPALSKCPAAKPLNFVEQGQNIFENMWRGALSTFPGYEPGMKLSELGGVQAQDQEKPVLFLTCDLPLAEPVEIDAFVNTLPLERADLIFGATRYELLAPYEPGEGKPGIRFIYFCMKDRLLRHANIFAFRPFKLGHVMETYIPLIYALRYQRHLRNVLKAALMTMRFAFRWNSLKLFFFAEAASYCHNHGYYRLREWLRKPLDMRWAESVASEAFSTRFAAHETIGPGLALDVDDEEAYDAFLVMFEEWKEIQKSQLQQAANR